MKKIFQLLITLLILGSNIGAVKGAAVSTLNSQADNSPYLTKLSIKQLTYVERELISNFVPGTNSYTVNPLHKSYGYWGETVQLVWEVEAPSGMVINEVETMPTNRYANRQPCNSNICRDTLIVGTGELTRITFTVISNGKVKNYTVDVQDIPVYRPRLNNLYIKRCLSSADCSDLIIFLDNQYEYTTTGLSDESDTEQNQGYVALNWGIEVPSGMNVKMETNPAGINYSSTNAHNGELRISATSRVNYTVFNAIGDSTTYAVNVPFTASAFNGQPHLASLSITRNGVEYLGNFNPNTQTYILNVSDIWSAGYNDADLRWEAGVPFGMNLSITTHPVTANIDPHLESTPKWGTIQIAKNRSTLINFIVTNNITDESVFYKIHIPNPTDNHTHLNNLSFKQIYPNGNSRELITGFNPNAYSYEINPLHVNNEPVKLLWELDCPDGTILEINDIRKVAFQDTLMVYPDGPTSITFAVIFDGEERNYTVEIHRTRVEQPRLTNLSLKHCQNLDVCEELISSFYQGTRYYSVTISNKSQEEMDRGYIFLDWNVELPSGLNLDVETVPDTVNNFTAGHVGRLKLYPENHNATLKFTVSNAMEDSLFYIIHITRNNHPPVEVPNLTSLSVKQLTDAGYEELMSGFNPETYTYHINPSYKTKQDSINGNVKLLWEVEVPPDATVTVFYQLEEDDDLPPSPKNYYSASTHRDTLDIPGNPSSVVFDVTKDGQGNSYTIKIPDSRPPYLINLSLKQGEKELIGRFKPETRSYSVFLEDNVAGYTIPVNRILLFYTSVYQRNDSKKFIFVATENIFQIVAYLKNKYYFCGEF